MDDLELIEELISDFKALAGGNEQWEWFIDQHTNGTVPMRLYLDNDKTSFEFYQSEHDEWVHFDTYLGWSDGICDLLTVLNINFEVA